MRIIVVGAGSFSGRAFIKYAKYRGHDVVGLSRPEHDLNGSLPNVAANLVRLGYDRVVNFAALNMVGESWQHAADYYRTNVIGLAALAAALIETERVTKFVNVSTPEVYGTTETFLKEGAPFRPSTPYAVSRAAGDYHLRILNIERGFPVCFTRTVNVYGPGQQLYRIIPLTALCAYTGRTLILHGGGASTRSFIHIDDVAAGILRVVEDGEIGQDYHMATGRQTTIREIVERVCELAGSRLSKVAVDAKDRPGKDMAYQLDDSKIRSQLGWSDSIALEHGLAQTVEWVRSNLDELRYADSEYRHLP